ncbi:MAG: hypothetical protein DI556_17430 [Rhodovulum sulfidophilum]|uniref:Uncharacterized protein n=1 Tax=Rhodovulum sulfidophilum TaxID=35806 RepID=A0A2W5N3P5_RHOSU|nr:MAG: hypothetical protein DI556_17430 [Rhodovulum sulfidophilum]
MIMALFSLASAMEDRSYALKKERRIFALGIRDVGVHVIGSGAGRQAVVSFEFGNGAVFRFLLDQPLFRKLSGVFDREFSQGLH